MIALLLAGTAFAAGLPRLVGHDYVAFQGPGFYLEYPKGWLTVGASGVSSFYWQVPHDEVRGRREPWAEIDVSREAYVRPRPKGLKDCGFAKIRGFDDFVREYDCKCCDPASCKPCGPRKAPRPPIGGRCGRFLSKMTLPLGSGRLYEERVDPSESGLPDGDARAPRHVVLLYDIQGVTDAFYRFELWVPRADYESHFLSHLKHLLDSFVPQPDARSLKSK